jgi:hypothetical protein
MKTSTYKVFDLRGQYLKNIEAESDESAISHAKSFTQHPMVERVLTAAERQRKSNMEEANGPRY